MATIWADLHTHTTCSDGQLTPAILVEKAAERGLKVLAVTDHDTVEGFEAAQAAGQRYGVEVVSGVELSAHVGAQEVHLLGYFFDPADTALRMHLHDFLTARQARADRIVERLNELDVPLQPEAVHEQAAGSHAVGRPHVAAALVAEGFVATTRSAFARYLKDDGPAFVSKPRVPAEKALALLHDAGGIGVLAHPGGNTSNRLLRRLVRAGLDGLEVYHPMHDPALARYYRRKTRELALFETGGSDYHGRYPGEEANLGAYGLFRRAFEELLDFKR